MGRSGITSLKKGFPLLRESTGNPGREKVLKTGRMVEISLLRVTMTTTRGLLCQAFLLREMVTSHMVHLQGFLLPSQGSTHHRTLLQGFLLQTSTTALHQDLLHHSALLDLSWTSLAQTTLLPLEIWNTTGLYHPTILGQGLKVLPGVGLMDLSRTEVVTGEDLMDLDLTEVVLMTTEGVLGQGVGLMVLDSMAHHLIDSTPLKDEEVSPVKGLAAQ